MELGSEPADCGSRSGTTEQERRVGGDSIGRQQDYS